MPIMREHAGGDITRFLASLPSKLPCKPKAIVIFTAHWYETGRPKGVQNSCAELCAAPMTHYHPASWRQVRLVVGNVVI